MTGITVTRRGLRAREVGTNIVGANLRGLCGASAVRGSRPLGLDRWRRLGLEARTRRAPPQHGPDPSEKTLLSAVRYASKS